MSTIEFSQEERRGVAASARHHTRREVKTLVKFTIVGGSGYLVNLAVFWLAEERLGLHYLLAATLAFLVAVGNNFHWNRRWTFDAVGAEAVHRQAHRFLIVSAIAFFLGIGVPDALTTMAGMKPLIAQAISLVVATPVGFVGNRLWTFASPGTIQRLARRIAALAGR